jgi:hypothetical protein
MELRNILQKRYKRKNFLAALGITTAGYVVMNSALYKIFGKKTVKNKEVKGSDIKIKINSSAVSRGKMPKGQIKTGETNV